MGRVVWFFDPAEYDALERISRAWGSRVRVTFLRGGGPEGQGWKVEETNAPPPRVAEPCS